MIEFESKEICGMPVITGSFKELPTCYVQSTKLDIDGHKVVVHFGLSKKMEDSDNAEFLPGKVCIDGVNTWTYGSVKAIYASSIARMHMFKNDNVYEYVIGLHGKFDHNLGSKSGLLAVIPLVDLVNGLPVFLGDHFTFLTPRSCLTQLKIKVAKQFNFNVLFSSSELEALNKAREEAEKNEVAKKAERYARKQAMRAIIAKRPQITVYADNGQQYYGCPVVMTGSDEVNFIGVGTYVGVSSYNDKTKEVGEPIEAFRMVVNHGSLVKIPVPPCKLSFEKKEQKIALGMTGAKIFLIKGDEKQAYPLFSSDNIKAIAAKIGNRELVVAMDSPKEGKYPLVSIKKGQQKVIGYFAKAA